MQTKEKILEAKNSKEEPQNRKPKLFGSFFAISAFTSALVGYFAFASMECLKSCESQSKVLQLSYWPHVIDEWNVNGNLRTMKRVFDRLGYKMVNGKILASVCLIHASFSFNFRIGGRVVGLTLVNWIALWHYSKHFKRPRATSESQPLSCNKFHYS